MFSYEYNELLIMKGIAISLLGYVAFANGEIIKLKKRNCAERCDYNSVFKLVVYILAVLIFFNVIMDIPLIGQNYNDADMWFTKGPLAYLFAIEKGFEFVGFGVMSYRHKLHIHRINKIEKAFVLIILIDIIFSLLIGTRTQPLAEVIILLYLYTCIYNKITKIKFFLILLAGMFFLTVISYIRIGYKFSAVNGIWGFASDLIINNRTLFVAMDYSKNSGHIINTFIIPMLGILPFLQSIYIKAFCVAPQYVNSSLFFTFQQFHSTTDVPLGLGTNIIASIYLGVGGVGVVFFMFALGAVNNFISTNSSNNISFSIINIIMLGICIFWTRAEYFYIMPTICYSFVVVIYMLFQRRAFVVRKQD